MQTNAQSKTDIRTLSLEKLTDSLVSMGEKGFRAKQVYEWLWTKSAWSFEEMTNLSKGLREKLNEQFSIRPIVIDTEQHSKDRTIKFRFRLHDGHLVEGVLIPSPDMERMTACVSSQVGCSLACSFCATGKMDRLRNLTAAEIYDQVVIIKRASEQNYERPLTNIVYMGMGEPLLNYREVLSSCDRISDMRYGLGMAAKRITVSTAGIAKMIRKLADDDTRFNLALSLHAANDKKRNEIMAINETNSLSVLADALRYYYDAVKRRVTYEYIAFNFFNDSLEDAAELVEFCKVVPCKVNIIEYNKVEGIDFLKSDEDRLLAFQNYLETHGVTTTLRRSRGKDIDAACGQLANK